MLAIFKFESGVVGSLIQTMLMHGSSYFTELDVFGDGFHIIVRDPYAHPAVLFRRPHSDCYEEVRAACVALPDSPGMHSPPHPYGMAQLTAACEYAGRHPAQHPLHTGLHCNGPIWACAHAAGDAAQRCTPQCTYTQMRGCYVLQVPLDAGKDIYEKQFEAFLRAVRTGDKSEVRCMYADAARTYEASWWITEASGSPSPDGSVPDG